MDGGLLSLKWNNHRSAFIHSLSFIRNQDDYNDVTIACDGKFFPSHKLVLSTCSEYFEEMFKHTQCKHPVIVLKDIRYDDLEALLNYMYLGEVNVLQNKLPTLIKAAECLKIRGLAVPDESSSSSTEEPRNQYTMKESRLESKKRKHDDDSNEFAVGDSSFRNSPLLKKNHSTLSSDSCNENISSGDDRLSPIPIKGSDFSKNSCLSARAEFSEDDRIKQEPEDFCNDSKVGIINEYPTAIMNSLSSSDNFSASEYPANEYRSETRPLKNSSSTVSNLQVEHVHISSSDAHHSQSLDINDVRATHHGKPRSSSVDMTNRSFQNDSTGEQARFNTSCPYCPYIARDKTNLRKHIFTHTGEKPFVCEFCYYSTTQNSNLHTHYKRHHPTALTPIIGRCGVITYRNPPI